MHGRFGVPASVKVKAALKVRVHFFAVQVSVHCLDVYMTYGAFKKGHC